MGIGIQEIGVKTFMGFNSDNIVNNFYGELKSLWNLYFMRCRGAQADDTCDSCGPGEWTHKELSWIKRKLKPSTLQLVLASSIISDKRHPIFDILTLTNYYYNNN